MSMLSLETVSIPAANPEWKFTPGILTDDVISELRKKVYDQKSKDYSIFGTILNGLGYIASNFQMQMPVVGEQFSNTVKQMSDEVNRLFNNEYSTYDYLTGNGPLGKFIKDYVEMYKLCNKVHHVENEFIHQTEPRVDAEHEYRHLFDYTPIRVTSSNNGVFMGPYGQLRDMIKTIQTFGYQTNICSNKDNLPKDSVLETRISLETGMLIHYGDFKQSGFYHRSLNGNSALSLLVLIANVRDTKVAYIIDLTNGYNSSNVMFYHHRCENVWVRNTDSSGEFYLTGTYEALKEEAELLFAQLGSSMTPNIDVSVRECVDRFGSIVSIFDKLKEKGNGVEKCLTNFFPFYNAVNCQFSFAIAGIRYSYSKFPITEENNEGYTLVIEKNIPPNSWSNDRWSFSIVVRKNEIQLISADSSLSANYLLKQVNQFIDNVLANEEVVVMVIDNQ